jgi:hypothetical protein
VNKETITFSDIETAKQNLPPDEYRLELQTAYLTDIKLSSVDAHHFFDLNSQGEVSPMRLKIVRFARLGANEANCSSLLSDYTIEGFRGTKAMIRIKASFETVLRSDKKLSKDFLIIYSRNSTDMQVWPYLRELAYAMTSRMGAAALTLPLLTDPAKLDPPVKRQTRSES